MSSRENKWLLLILLLALVMRLWGIGYGLPYFFVGDEQPLVYGALKMAQLKTLLPVFHPQEFRPLYYPPLMSYLYLVFLSPFLLIRYLLGSWSSLAAFQNYLILNPGFIWLLARIFNLLIGLASIGLIYLIGKKFFHHWIGLLSALFLSLSFFHLQLSHFTRHWIPAVFFAYLVIYFSVCLYKNRQRKDYLWAGLTAGLAFGVSYITAIALLIPVLVHFLKGRVSFLQKLRDKRLWLMLIIFLMLAFGFVLLHPQEFFRIAFGSDSTVTQAKGLSEFLSSFGYYFIVMLFYEPVILLFALVGLILIWFKSRKEWLFFILWPAAYIAVLYFFFHQETRYIIFILPWLALVAGYGLYGILRKISSRPWRAMFLIMVFIFPLAVSWQYSSLLSQKDTRILAKEWIEENIPAGEKIITDWSGIKLVPTKEAIRLQESLAEDSLRRNDRVLLSWSGQGYPQPAYNLLRLHFLDKPVSHLGYHYFVIAYWERQNLKEEDWQIINQGRLIKRFDPGLAQKGIDLNGNVLEWVSVVFRLKRLGPIVEIYQL